ncbi:hypothetical protein ACO0LO_10590 [Undibacterium sp. TJN25]|uniref:hypothetical protein n=1 Tax=Undibacterium sp. TJN25 TaxID=3413056 RepID=UPI003BF0D0E4
MDTSSLVLLDQEELQQLALAANRSQTPGAAIAYLKEAVSRADATANSHFLLGAEYAQVRIFDRALKEFESALAIDPALAIARFQLGLLLYTLGEKQRSGDILKPLYGLGESNPLSHFGKAVDYLNTEQFAKAIVSLSRGIELNPAQRALTQEMQKMVEELRKLPPELLKDRENADSSDEGLENRLLLSAYAGNSIH